MLTTNDLRAWGANVDEALVRCMNNETFYLMLVGKAVRDPQFDRLEDACASGDLDQGFDAAHALKGMMANLALTPILQPVEKITELLRGRTKTNYTPLVEEIMQQRSRLMERM